MMRKAKIQDIKQIQGLINYFAKQDVMLARSLNELYENIRDFWVFEKKNRVLGVCAMHISWADLAEIKSLAVDKAHQGKGIGKQLVRASLDEAKQLGARNVFVLTYKPDFFRQFGFKRIKNAELPHKIWAECINCCKFPNCNEIALIKKL